jgi:undecaprenyl-diphosphatase
MTTAHTRHDKLPDRRPHEREGSAHHTADAVRFAAVRLIAGAVLIWALLSAIGYTLTHWLAGSAFEKKDAWIDRWFASRRDATWNTVTQVGSHLAETMTIIALGVIAFVALRLVLGRWRESIFVAIALIGEVSIFVCTTLVIDRPRPAVTHLDAAPPTSSFPSGHTAAAVTLYGAIAIIVWSCSQRSWLRGLFGVLAVFMPVAVALSRMYRGMHYPTDVLGGALLGVLWLSVTSVVLMRGVTMRGDTMRGEKARGTT